MVNLSWAAPEWYLTPVLCRVVLADIEKRNMRTVALASNQLNDHRARRPPSVEVFTMTLSKFSQSVTALGRTLGEIEARRGIASPPVKGFARIDFRWAMRLALLVWR